MGLPKNCECCKKGFSAKKKHVVYCSARCATLARHGSTPETQQYFKPRIACVHCRRECQPINRGLCSRCYRTERIKRLYPRLKTGPKPKIQEGDTPPKPVRSMSEKELVELVLEMAEDMFPGNSDAYVGPIYEGLQDAVEHGVKKREDLIAYVKKAVKTHWKSESDFRVNSVDALKDRGVEPKEDKGTFDFVLPETLDLKNTNRNSDGQMKIAVILPSGKVEGISLAQLWNMLLDRE